MKGNKLWFLAGMVLFGLALLAGCGKKDPNKVRLQFMIWGRTEEIKAVQGFIEKFNKVYPNIEVQMIHEQQYYDKLKTMMSGGTPPDVFYMGSEDFPAYVTRDSLMDLGPFIQKDPDTNLKPTFSLADFYPQTVEPFKYQGRIYGIPKDFTTMVLYYNKTLFDREGLAYPNANWTWDDFLNAAQKLTKFEVQGKIKVATQFGFVFENWSGYWLPWIKQNGGELMSADHRHWVIGKTEYLEKNTETFQFLYDLMYKYHYAPTMEETKDTGTSQMFETGKVGMATYGRWRCLELKDVKDFQWDLSVMPHKMRHFSTLFTVCYSIAKNTKHPLESWKLLKFLVGETGQINTAESALAIPTMKKFAQSDHFMKTKILPKINAQAYLDQIPYAESVPVNEFSPEVNIIIGNNLDKVFVQKQPIKQVLIQMQAEIDKAVH